MDHLVLTVIAQDQPGLVERVAQCISAHGGNWLESRMSRMAGQFAGILRVDVPLSAHAGLLVALDALQDQGIRVQVAAGGDAPLSAWQGFVWSWWVMIGRASCATSHACSALMVSIWRV